MNFQTMSKQRKFILIAALAGIIGMFLPWYTFSLFGVYGSVNGMHGEGLLVFLCFAVSAVIAYLGDQTKTLLPSSWIIVLICGALATLIVAWNMLRSNDYGLLSSMSFGIYLVVIAAIGVVAAAFIFRSPTDTIKGGFDSFKKDVNDRIKNTENNNPGNTNPPL